jgi:cytidylate kinase
MRNRRAGYRDRVPEAILKVWLAASEETRMRRYSSGETPDQIRQRDESDRTRAVGVNLPASDYVLLDTEDLDANAVAEEIVRMARERL